MAYDDSNFHQVGGATPSVSIYLSSVDDIATIATPGYFQPLRNLQPSDIILAVSRSGATPDLGLLVINSVSPQISVTDFAGGGGGGGGGGVTSVVGQTGVVTADQIKTALDAIADTNFLTDSERAAIAGLGTAAILNVGTSAGNVVQLDASARLPAVDGSQLTNLPSGGSVAASAVSFTPAGNLSATDVQAALVELDTEKGSAITGGTAGQVHMFDGTNDILADQLVEIPVNIGTVADGRALKLRLPWPYQVIGTVDDIVSGSCSYTVQISGSDVTGLANIAVSSSTETARTATAGNVGAATDRLSMVISSNASGSGLFVSIRLKRVGV